jgi:hypothetical protein
MNYEQNQIKIIDENTADISKLNMCYLNNLADMLGYQFHIKRYGDVVLALKVD